MPNALNAKKAKSANRPSATPKKKPPGKKPKKRKSVKTAKTGKSKKTKQKKKLDLSNPKVRAKLKKKNLARLEIKAPDLYRLVENYEPLTKLVFGDDGRPDVIFEGEYFYNQRYDEYVSRQLKGFWRDPKRMRIAPMQPETFDDTAGLFIHKILERGTNKGIDFHVGHTSEESYFLYIFGLGFGKHIDELVKKTNCQALVIADPNPEFLYHSLELYDWGNLFDTLEKREAVIQVFIESDPVVLSYKIRTWLRGSNPMAVDGATYYAHYNNPIFAAAIQRLDEDKELILSGLGFFYDETLMIKNTHHNLYPGTERVYMRTMDPRIDAPVFVIGNGPSLDNDLDFLRENQDRAIIVSSGSALRPLILSGVVPDFQMETENIDVFPLIDQVAKDHDISKVCLVTSSTVDIKVPPLFDDLLYYFRGSLSPFALFCNTHERCLAHPNPTVVNASLSFAQELGFRTFYFFGTDLGTTMGVEKHHSKHAYQYTEGAIVINHVYNIPIQANFGGVCMASDGMFWTRDAIEKAIRETSSGRRYFNCSDGALIEGAVSMPSNLLELDDLPEGKQLIIDKIKESFPVYNRKEFDDHWEDDKLQGYFNEWLDEFITLSTDVPNYNDRTYLTKIMAHFHPMKRLHPGSWGPALLFRGTLFQIMMSVEFYLRRIVKKDVRKFEKIIREEINHAVDYLRETAEKEFGTLSKDAAKRIKKANSKKKKASSKTKKTTKKKSSKK